MEKSLNQQLVKPGIKNIEALLFEKSQPGRTGYSLPEPAPRSGTSDFEISAGQKRQARLNLPELSEGEVVRHYTRLSSWNFSIDQNFYPLGSCTMKYNPRINEEIAADTGWAALHPEMPEEQIQGAFELIYNLEQALMTITDMPAISLQPAAGAHGELTGLFLVRNYFMHKGEDRPLILVPDSAHGTNPATCTLAGFDVKSLKSDERGKVDVEELKKHLNEKVACFMVTNPNTLGVFEDQIPEISRILKENGSLLYMDGANFNAIIGQVSLSQMGIDVCHLNLHKTFSTPHGGGGPGSGPIVVSKTLEPFLPGPRIRKNGGLFETYTPEQSIGRVKSYMGHFGMFVRAYTYILSYGKGIGQVAEHAVLNSNYIRHNLKEIFQTASPDDMLHEAVFSDKVQKPSGVTTLDIAKTLLDYGIHPPTIYFPLIVPGAMMIEPTETEPQSEMDNFINVMKEIDHLSKTDPEKLKNRPYSTYISKVDEVSAARNPKLSYFSA